MEETKILEQLGSPNYADSISQDMHAHADPTVTVAAPAQVGLIVAHHFEQYQRQKQSHLRTAAQTPHAVTRSPHDHNTNLDPAPAVSGFRGSHHFCRLCSQMLPVASFYPSNLKRGAFYCKACSTAKYRSQTASKRAKLQLPSSEINNDPTLQLKKRPSAADPDRSSKSDTALKMLNRLRRMCARPSACGFRTILPAAVSLNFDVKVAQDLLLWWRYTSALTSDTADHDVGQVLKPSDEELRFIPWLPQQRPDPSSPLQPWEVIPVTRLQASRLTSTPSHLWAELLEPAAVARVVAKTAELQSVILKGKDLQY